MDDSNAAIPIFFKSYKSCRVTRSILPAGVVDFADLLDDAFTIRSQLEQATSRAVPMHLLTDSKSLFEITSKSCRTNEKRIMLSVHTARQNYRNQEILNIGFVKFSANIAHGLTKAKMQNNLLELLQTVLHDVDCEQWIFR